MTEPTTVSNDEIAPPEPPSSARPEQAPSSAGPWLLVLLGVALLLALFVALALIAARAG